jgi:Lipocalin-like domain
MKTKIAFILLATILLSCGTDNANKKESTSERLMGTWKLLSGTLIEKGDTVVTDYTKNLSFIKIINDTHFAFLQHDLNKGKDSAAVFVAGGGQYSLKDSVYTEHLEYCSAREWEGHDFSFSVSIKNDTLIQQGIEKVEGAGVNRINIEKYIKVKG